MAEQISISELRNHAAELLRRVEAGARLEVTVDRRAVAELVPLKRPAGWVPRQRAVEALVQADPALRRELDAALMDTIADA